MGEDLELFVGEGGEVFEEFFPSRGLDGGKVGFVEVCAFFGDPYDDVFLVIGKMVLLDKAVLPERVGAFGEGALGDAERFRDLVHGMGDLAMFVEVFEDLPFDGVELDVAAKIDLDG